MSRSQSTCTEIRVWVGCVNSVGKTLLRSTIFRITWNPTISSLVVLLVLHVEKCLKLGIV